MEILDLVGHQAVQINGIGMAMVCFTILVICGLLSIKTRA